MAKRCECGNEMDLVYETEIGDMCPTCWDEFYNKKMKMAKEMEEKHDKYGDGCPNFHKCWEQNRNANTNRNTVINDCLVCEKQHKYMYNQNVKNISFNYSNDMKKDEISKIKFGKALLRVNTVRGTYLGIFISVDENEIIIKENQMTPNIIIKLKDVNGISWW